MRPPRPGYYVLDGMASSLTEAIVSGPFDTPEEAESDLAEWNIAGDCHVAYVDYPHVRQWSV